MRAGAGVRPLSLGGAFVAVANDVTAGYWNPAGLGQLSETQLVGMYSLLSMNRMYNYAAIAHPIKSYGTLGFSWINFQVGDIESRDSGGNVTGTFGNLENAFIFSYGRAIGKIFFIGANAKYLLQSLAGSNAHGLSFDFGSILKPVDSFSIGLSVQDILGKFKWNTAAQPSYSLPLTLRSGIAIHPTSFPLLFTFDFEKNNMQKSRFHGGVELLFVKEFGLRMGNDNGTFTFGGTISVPMSNNELEMDYGFLPNDGIAQSPTHRFSLLLKLSKPSELNPIAEKKPKPLKPPVSQTVRQKPRNHDHISKNKNNSSHTSVLLAKVLKVKGDYIIINIGAIDGLTIGLQYDLFLKVERDGGVAGAQNLGRVEVFKTYKNTSAIRIVSRANAYVLKARDVVGLKSFNTTHKQ